MRKGTSGADIGHSPRFLEGLASGSRGLRNVDTSDLDAELTREQARAVLGLSGMEAHAGDLGASRPAGGGRTALHIRRWTRWSSATPACIGRPEPLADETGPAHSARVAAVLRQLFPAPGDLARQEDAGLLLTFRAALDTAQETAEAHAVAAVLAACGRKGSAAD